jgi:hypothetical protein
MAPYCAHDRSLVFKIASRLVNFKKDARFHRQHLVAQMGPMFRARHCCRKPSRAGALDPNLEVRCRKRPLRGWSSCRGSPTRKGPPAWHGTPLSFGIEMDTRTPEKRGRIMKSVGTANTGPESCPGRSPPQTRSPWSWY